MATPVEFRLYLYGGGSGQFSLPYDATTGSGSGSGPISIDGTTVIIPEPGTYALLLVGIAVLLVALNKRRNSAS